jgi:hypothetical protein
VQVLPHEVQSGPPAPQLPAAAPQVWVVELQIWPCAHSAAVAQPHAGPLQMPLRHCAARAQVLAPATSLGAQTVVTQAVPPALETWHLVAHAALAQTLVPAWMVSQTVVAHWWLPVASRASPLHGMPTVMSAVHWCVDGLQ